MIQGALAPLRELEAPAILRQRGVRLAPMMVLVLDRLRTDKLLRLVADPHPELAVLPTTDWLDEHRLARCGNIDTANVPPIDIVE